MLTLPIIMDSNFWFYTLSAVPQTLAAVIALVATFSVFKISKIYELIEQIVDSVKDYLLPLDPSKEIHEIENFDARDVLAALNEGLKKIPRNNMEYESFDNLRDLLSKEIERRHRHFEATPERIYEFLLQKRNALSGLLEQRRIVRRQILISFILNAATILMALILLPTFNVWSGNCRIGLLVMVVMMATISLIYTVCSAYKIARF